MPETSNISKDDNQLLQRLQAECTLLHELGLLSHHENSLTHKWKRRVDQEPKRFINPDGALNVSALRNFRRLHIFVTDSPGKEYNKLNRLNPINYLLAGRRGDKNVQAQRLSLLKKRGFDHLLKKYPCPTVGNPRIFYCSGYQYTERWTKHIHHLGMMKQVLGMRLEGDLVAMDLGSSYGIFSSLVKGEFPQSTSVLVDFPEHLILAHYFLGRCWPDARIAGLQDLIGQETISRSFLKEFDFVLVPVSYFSRLAPDSVDLVTNFASLGEMTREWFDFYLKSPVFTTAQYFFTANRIQSYPDYDNELTILDYPIWNPQKRLHFTISPPYSGIYWHIPRGLIFSERVAPPAYFEYVGHI